MFRLHQFLDLFPSADIREITFLTDSVVNGLKRNANMSLLLTNFIIQMQKELNEDKDYRQIIIRSYHQLLNILDRYGFIMTNTQTAREFTEVMSRALPIPTPSVKLLTSLFEIARYSGIKPDLL